MNKSKGLSAQEHLGEQVGANGMVEGTHVRDIYFGELMEVEDA